MSISLINLFLLVLSLDGKKVLDVLLQEWHVPTSISVHVCTNIAYMLTLHMPMHIHMPMHMFMRIPMHVLMRMCGCMQVSMSICRLATCGAVQSTGGVARVCVGWHEYLWMHTGACGLVRVCA